MRILGEGAEDKGRASSQRLMPCLYQHPGHAHVTFALLAPQDSRLTTMTLGSVASCNIFPACTRWKDIMKMSTIAEEYLH